MGRLVNWIPGELIAGLGLLTLGSWLWKQKNGEQPGGLGRNGHMKIRAECFFNNRHSRLMLVNVVTCDDF